MKKPKRKDKPKRKHKRKSPYEPDAEYWKAMDVYFQSNRFKLLNATIKTWNEIMDDMPLPHDLPLTPRLKQAFDRWLEGELEIDEGGMNDE